GDKPDRKLAKKWERDRNLYSANRSINFYSSNFTGNVGNSGNVNGGTSVRMLSQKNDKEKSQEEMEKVSPSPTPPKPVTPNKRTLLEQWEESDDVIEGEETSGEEMGLTSKLPKRRRPHDDEDENEDEDDQDVARVLFSQSKGNALWLNKLEDIRTNMIENTPEIITHRLLRRKIVDISLPAEGQPMPTFHPSKMLTSEEYAALRNEIFSGLKNMDGDDDWRELSTSSERILQAFLKIDSSTLANLVRMIARKGRLTVAKESQDSPVDISDCDDPDVEYILDLLRYNVEIIDSGITTRANSERDNDYYRF
ncbi:hypothetical protein BC938DRAFT_472632, partial [Jimgerdemannia flammicorona]